MKSVNNKNDYRNFNFFLLYLAVFTIFNSDERKLKFGITLPIFNCLLNYGGIFLRLRLELLQGLSLA